MTNSAQQRLDYGLQLAKHEAIPLRAARNNARKSLHLSFKQQQPHASWIEPNSVQKAGHD